jgi:predicted nucleic acid-binding protein
LAALIVLDSGILIARLIPEAISEKATAFMDQLERQQIQIVAPMLFRYEMVAVTRKALYQKRIDTSKALVSLDLALSYPINYLVDEALLRRAYELATLHNRPTAYDSQYLAVAERYQCEFWTADERFYNAINAEWSQIRWLGNWTAP